MYELNSSLSKGYQLTNITSELITCKAGQIREYIFPNLPKHELSLPFIDYATVTIEQTNVYRNMFTTGAVRVYSPIDQDVEVMLVLFNTVVNNE